MHQELYDSCKDRCILWSGYAISIGVTCQSDIRKDTEYYITLYYIARLRPTLGGVAIARIGGIIELGMIVILGER